MRPSRRTLDGLDISPALLGTGPSPRDTMIYYRGTKVFALRKGVFKAHFRTKEPTGEEADQDPPLLYNLEEDPSEKYNIAQSHPEIVAQIQKALTQHLTHLTKGQDQLAGRIPKTK